MKPLFTFLFCLPALFNFAQAPSKPVNIILTGKVNSYQAAEKPHIYFAMAGHRFTSRDRIKMDASQAYTFDLSKTRYKNTTSGILVFTLDSTSDMNAKYSCVHRINLGEIIKYANSKKMKAITLTTDLVMEFLCETGIEDKGAKDEEVQMVGSYQFTSKDTVRAIRLEQDDYVYNASFNYFDKDLMNEWIGRWSYRYGDLVLRAWFRINRNFGTMLPAGYEKTYKTRNENGSMALTSADGEQYVRQLPQGSVK